MVYEQISSTIVKASQVKRTFNFLPEKLKSQSEKTFEEEFNFIEKRVYEFILGGLGARVVGQSPKLSQQVLLHIAGNFHGKLVLNVHLTKVSG